MYYNKQTGIYSYDNGAPAVSQSWWEKPTGLVNWQLVLLLAGIAGAAAMTTTGRQLISFPFEMIGLKAQTGVAKRKKALKSELGKWA